MGIDSTAITLLGLRFTKDEYHSIFFDKVSKFNVACRKCQFYADKSERFCGQCGNKIELYDDYITKKEFTNIPYELFNTQIDKNHYYYLSVDYIKKYGHRLFEHNETAMIDWNARLIERMEKFKKDTMEWGIYNEETFGIHCIVEISY